MVRTQEEINAYMRQFTQHFIAWVTQTNEKAAEPAEPAEQAAPPPPATAKVSGFKLSAKSERELAGVHPVLVRVVRRAIDLTEQDFMVFDGLRTEAEQRQHIKNGVSKTLDSKHIKQKDGWGHAVDLVPIIGGLPKWDWEGCYRIAVAVDKAATELGVAHRITWGGAWDKTLDKYGGDAKAFALEVLAYANRHPGKDFIDGPHFQIA